MWRNDISGPDECGRITYPDQLDVEESHIRTRCVYVEESHIWTRYMWRNDICGPDRCGGMTYPDQMHVEE
jgi:hypothetical protein